MKSKPGRPYRMTARAEAAEQTGERIVDAMLGRYASTPYDQVRLDDIAADAGVTVQTVVRRFGSKHGLLAATVTRELGRIAAERAAASGADPARILRDLVGYYERQGSLILKVYAEAHQAPGVPELAARGREFHVRWCHRAFSAWLPVDLTAATRRRRLAQVVAVCDATTWRILREDGRLTPAQTEKALLEMVQPLLARPAVVPTGPGD
jgi:AcrR family transcriptional regulator